MIAVRKRFPEYMDKAGKGSLRHLRNPVDQSIRNQSIVSPRKGKTQNFGKEFETCSLPKRRESDLQQKCSHTSKTGVAKAWQKLHDTNLQIDQSLVDQVFLNTARLETELDQLETTTEKRGRGSAVAGDCSQRSCHRIFSINRIGPGWKRSDPPKEWASLALGCARRHPRE